MRTGANALFLKANPEYNRIILFVKWQIISMLESIFLRQFASKETMHTIHTTAKENTRLKEKRVSETQREHAECFFNSTYSLWALKRIIATHYAVPWINRLKLSHSLHTIRLNEAYFFLQNHLSSFFCGFSEEGAPCNLLHLKLFPIW